MPRVDYVFLDFDGTIMTYDEPPGFFHPAVIEWLNGLEDRGVRWCTNSGRDLRGQREILEASIRKGLVHLPAAMLCSESYIFERSNGDYLAAEPWNTQARTYLRDVHRRVHALLLPRLSAWFDECEPERVYIEDEATVFLVPDVDGRIARLQSRLENLILKVPDSMVTRNGGWVVVLPSQLGKGGVITAYLERHGVSAAHVLAIGDHVNDLSMLDGSSARLVGCPGDAVEEVKDVVRSAGGCVAAAQGPLGTLEVLNYFMKNA